MISNGLGTIANIILDPVLILGFGMGVAGAAVATVIGNGISFLYLPVLFGLNALFGLNGVIYTAPLTDMLSLLAGAVLCFLWNKKLKKD